MNTRLSVSRRTLLAALATTHLSPYANGPSLPSLAAEAKPLDLAAVALRGMDLPTGMGKRSLTTFVTADRWPTVLPASTLPTGLRRVTMDLLQASLAGPNLDTTIWECADSDAAIGLSERLTDLQAPLQSYSIKQPIAPLQIQNRPDYTGFLAPQEGVDYGCAVLVARHENIAFRIQRETRWITAGQIESGVSPGALEDLALEMREIMDALIKRLKLVQIGESPSGVKLAWPDRLMPTIAWGDDPRESETTYGATPTFDDHSLGLTQILGPWKGSFARGFYSAGSTQRHGLPWIRLTIDEFEHADGMEEAITRIDATPDAFSPDRASYRYKGHFSGEPPELPNSSPATAWFGKSIYWRGAIAGGVIYGQGNHLFTVQVDTLIEQDPYQLAQLIAMDQIEYARSLDSGEHGE